MRGRSGLSVRGAVVGVALALVGTGCAQGESSSAGPQTRTVQVDYRHDEVETSMLEYYPRRLQIRPGDTVEFKQAWTGEPHSVTMGRLVDEKIGPMLDLFDRVKKDGRIPEADPPEFEEFAKFLPYAFAEEGMAQNAAQPCYVDADGFDGKYPGDERTPCPKRPQPEFNGRQAIYNSGIIPYEGVGGNTFTVKLADDLEPGTYTYFCNVHSALQYGQLDVKPKGTEIPSRPEVARQARAEAEKAIAPLLRNFRAARQGKVVIGGDNGEVRVDAGRTNLVGVPTRFLEDNEFVHGIVNEFVPEEIEARVGRKVTWTFTGGHTISFNVPRYFPVFTVAKDGRVDFNPQAEQPAGGWPGRPEPPGGEGHEEGSGPPQPVKVDAGPWDGTGFRSTGLDYQDLDEFSVTFTRPGTYTYACLIHPQMVGRVVVKS